MCAQLVLKTLPNLTSIMDFIGSSLFEAVGPSPGVKNLHLRLEQEFFSRFDSVADSVPLSEDLHLNLLARKCSNLERMSVSDGGKNLFSFGVLFVARFTQLTSLELHLTAFGPSPKLFFLNFPVLQTLSISLRVSTDVLNRLDGSEIGMALPKSLNWLRISVMPPLCVRDIIEHSQLDQLVLCEWSEHEIGQFVSILHFPSQNMCDIFVDERPLVSKGNIDKKYQN
jgi:hypothetical protein